MKELKTTMIKLLSPARHSDTAIVKKINSIFATAYRVLLGVFLYQ